MRTYRAPYLDSYMANEKLDHNCRWRQLSEAQFGRHGSVRLICTLHPAQPDDYDDYKHLRC